MTIHRSGDGAPRHVLRSAKLASPTQSVHMSADDMGDLAERCRATQHALAPVAVFTHLTSAALRGWRLPQLATVPIIASTSDDAPHHDRRGVYVRRCDVPDVHRETWDGIRIASPEWTIVELAEDLGLIDLVAVIDGVLHVGSTSSERIRDAIVPGRRGARTLRQALALADARSESWWESVLRMAHQLAGIPVTSQVDVLDDRGVFVARSDLQIVGTNRYPEYDGSEHRDRDRHRHDLRRDKGLSRLGGERFGYTSVELVDTPMLVIRDAEDALGWAHDTARAKMWLYELDRSSVSRPGWARLQRRLRRFARPTSPRAKPSKTSRVAQDG